MSQLDHAALDRLLRNPKGEPELLERLKAGDFDELLAARPELDGETDRLLLALAPKEAPLDELGWRRLRSKLLPQRRAPAAMLALAAGLAAVVGAGTWALGGRVEPVTEPGLKGAGKLLLGVEAAKQRADGAFEVLRSDDEVKPGTVLAFRVTSPLDGPARVFLQRATEVPEELAQVRVKQGAAQLEQESGLFGVNLEDEQGPVTIWVVAGEGLFDVEQALAAIAGKPSPLVVGKVGVRVKP
ncbi:MAG: hypothetical protein MUC96_11575 [Myxococcaceae bacterium]|jgi:hypothetical protein|nr:hypothetical protein [Myxococcaceae bacterium]